MCKVGDTIYHIIGDADYLGIYPLEIKSVVGSNLVIGSSYMMPIEDLDKILSDEVSGVPVAEIYSTNKEWAIQEVRNALITRIAEKMEKLSKALNYVSGWTGDNK